MEFTSDLLSAARSVVRSEFSNCRTLGPIHARLFRRALERELREPIELSPAQCVELFEAARSDAPIEEKPESEGSREPSAPAPDREAPSENPAERPEIEDDYPEPGAREYDEPEYDDEPEPEYDSPDPEREARREALAAVNEVLDVYYPHKTLSAATDFDRFRALFTERLPRVGREITDERLRLLLFSAGGTLIGTLKPRKEREAYLKSLGFLPPDAPDASPAKRPAPQVQKTQEAMGLLDDSDLNEQAAEITEMFGSAVERKRQVAPPRYPEPAPEVRDAPSRPYDDYRPRDDRGYGRPYDRDYPEDRYYDDRLYSYGGGRGYDPRERRYERADYDYDRRYAGPSRDDRGYYGSCRDDRWSDERDYAPRYVPERGPREYREFRSPTPPSRDQRDDRGANGPDEPSLSEVVQVAREILDRYFEDRQVRSLDDLKKFRYFIQMKLPTFSYDDDRLRKLVSYSGGTYLGPYGARAERAAAVPREKINPSLDVNGGAQTREEVWLDGARAILARSFPDRIVTSPRGVDQFYRLFQQEFPGTQLPPAALRRLLEVAGAIVRDEPRETDSSARDANVEIAKLTLREHFPNQTFKSDMSDFKRFRIQFEVEAGPGARRLSDEELRQAFVAAGGVFAEPVQEAEASEPEEGAEENLSRAEIFRRIASTEFPKGIDPTSREDMAKLREISSKRYDMDFSRTTDEKLAAALARSLVLCDGKFHMVDDFVKEQIKDRVASLFRIGARVVYYETFLQKNADWLRAAGVESVELLRAYFAKFFSSLFFYADYVEEKEWDESERVKIESEIDRVWGSSSALSAATIASRIYAPLDRVRKVLEINPDKYEPLDGLFKRKYASLDPEEIERLDDLFDAEFANNSLALDDEETEENESPTQGNFAFEESGSEEDEEDEGDNETEDEESEDEEDDEEDEDDEESEEDEEEDEEYEDDASVEIPEVSEKAVKFVKNVALDWFEEGGNLIYYQAMLTRYEEELEELGVETEAELVRALLEAFPEYFFYDEYMEREASDLDEPQKIKKELELVWSEDSASRRIAEITEASFLSKEALEENYEAMGLEKRSNGYLTRPMKRIEGSRRYRRLVRRRGGKSKK